MDARCNLIVDSCCDLPFDVVDRPGIDVIEFPYVMDGCDYVDDLYRSLSPHDFYEAMRDKKRPAPTTAQIPVATLRETFERAIQTGVPTVYLSFSSGLSGSYDAAVLVRDALAVEYPASKLYVVDTKLASIAEGLLVLGAIEQREAGLSAEEMVEWVREARYYVGSLFMVDDLDSLRRGGRIPASVALAGAKLDVKALLSFDLEGHLSLSGVARGRKKGIRQLAEYALARANDTAAGVHMVVADADAPKDTQRLRETIDKQRNGVVFLSSQVGPVIGSHVGPGMVAVVFWGPDRREDLSVAERIARRVKDRG
ncbi:degV family protein [Cryptobacterium curtum DSM 15641]|uniref:DegV family protein n=1 Tax=Cryptobacterium curtum (strain ATCC 700683 / DSM 15641 / CCUG 43107 / 12-3) TaxID=469378 RepID=C7MNX4_CRYCD|nr:DegV family protein [Cryptobacterium curtum]ACU94614.1 degV family protein [Cryptobacterium curtum DSM 15641]